MSKRAIKRILDVCGALVSFCLPAGAAISEFPRVQAATAAEGNKWLAALNLSAAAFAIVAVLALVTAMRFFRHRLKAPRSGLAVATVLYLFVRGFRLIIKPMETILFWSMVGCAIAWVLYCIADRLCREGRNSA